MSGPSGSPAGARLLLVVPSATSFVTFLREVAEEWRNRGGMVAVATGPDLTDHVAQPGRGAWPAGVERLSLPVFRGGAPVSLARAAGRLAAVIGTWRPDVVHAHFAAAVCAAALARAFCRARAPVWVGTFHGLHGVGGSGTRRGWAAAVERWSAGRMTQVCLLNADDGTALRRLVGVPIHVPRSCGVGCDLEHFDGMRFTAAERERLRRDAGIDPGAFVVVFVGRQAAFKGFPLVVRAHRLLAEAGVGHVLVTVGVPDRLHDPGLSPVERRSLDADSHVIRAGWQWDVAPWLAIADACVLPSAREGMPVSLMESLAMGVPVVTSDSRGCRDVVRHEVDGLVLPAPTPETLAAAVRRLVGDRHLLDSMRAAARAGRGRFDRRWFVVDQMDLYTRLLHGCVAAADGGATSAAAVPISPGVRAERGS